MTDWPNLDDRPSGILRQRRRFSVEKFVAWTAALSVGAGLGVAAWTMLSDDDEPEDTQEAAEATPSVGEGTTTAETPSAPPDVGGPRLDLGGPPRLDIPEPFWADSSPAAPSELPGPDVEIPEW